MPNIYLLILSLISLAIAFALYKTKIFPRVNWTSKAMNTTIANSGGGNIMMPSSDDNLSEKTGKVSINALNHLSLSIIMIFVVLGCAFIGYYFSFLVLFPNLPGYAAIGMANFILIAINVLAWTYIFSRMALTLLIFVIAIHVLGFAIYLAALGGAYVYSFATASDYTELNKKIRKFDIYGYLFGNKKDVEKIKRQTYYECFFNLSLKKSGQFEYVYRNCVLYKDYYNDYIKENGN